MDLLNSYKKSEVVMGVFVLFCFGILFCLVLILSDWLG